MDDDTRDLIIRLATRIGMLMEDVGPIAILIAGQPEADIRTAAKALAKASGDIAALVSAIDKLAAE